MAPSHFQRQLFFLKLLFLVSLVSFASATCYSYNGTPKDDSYKPCNGSAPVSMCCHLGFTNNNGDSCGSGSSYGLCGVTGSQLWRESCTDPTWKSLECLKLCVTGNGTSADAEITACDDGSYCCGANNATCCNAGQGVFIVNNQVAVSRSAISSTSSTSPTSSQFSIATPSLDSSLSTASTTYTSTATPTSSSPSPSAQLQNTGLSTGAKAGAGVGVAIGAIALLGIAAFILMKRTRGREHYDTSTYIYQGMEKSTVKPTINGGELEGSWRGHEIEAKGSQPHSRIPVEMP